MQQQNGYYLKEGAQYPLVALGTALLALIVVATAQSARLVGNLQGLPELLDVHVAALMSAASLVIFSGLWSLDPQTRSGRWALHIALAALVALNWAAWVVAMWWH